jgi:tetratricopeptide (TPR) repeat protein
MPVFLLLSFLLSAGAVFASPRINPEPFYEWLGGANEPLTVDLLIDASLRASDASEEKIKTATARINEAIQEMKDGIASEWDERQKAEYVLMFLHKNLFRVYDEFQTRVDRVMEDGSYNCVSSAVLYMIFLRSIGIPVIGIGTEDHAFCAAILPGGNIDVETTSVYGFDPGKKTEFHDAFGNVTGYSYVPPSNYSARSELSERQLLALILQNRISLLESKKRYEDALELAVDRYAVAPGVSTKNHLYRGAINYAALLNERKEYAQAIDFLTRFVDTHGWSDSVRDIYGILHYNRVVLFIQSGAFEEAIETLSRLEVASWIEPEVVKSLRSQVAERILAKELPVLTPDEGFELLGVLRDDGLVSPERYTDYAIMLVSTEAEEFAASGDFLAAAAVIDQAIGGLGSDRRLIAARDAYRYNFAVEAHNTFAGLFNNGKYTEAKKLLAESIERVPDSDILHQDMTLLERILAE